MANICRDGGGGYATTDPLRGSSPFCGFLQAALRLRLRLHGEPQYAVSDGASACGICGTLETPGTLETRETPGTPGTPETRETPGTPGTRETPGTLCYSLTSILQRTRGQRYGGWWGDVNPNTV